MVWNESRWTKRIDSTVSWMAEWDTLFLVCMIRLLNKYCMRSQIYSSKEQMLMWNCIQMYTCVWRNFVVRFRSQFHQRTFAEENILYYICFFLLCLILLHHHLLLLIFILLFAVAYSFVFLHKHVMLFIQMYVPLLGNWKQHQLNRNDFVTLTLSVIQEV